ncbi:hypothetical protein, partial [Xanthovirga aplysinae]|uniref:hypothetical protein n=1 Tax=Xanthovirga aplysinae TaxID=2529853 RepID=UPI001CA3FBCB
FWNNAEDRTEQVSGECWMAKSQSVSFNIASQNRENPIMFIKEKNRLPFWATYFLREIFMFLLKKYFFR